MLKKVKLSAENIISIIISLGLAINSILFIWFKTNSAYLMFNVNPSAITSHWHYPIYLTLSVALLGNLFYNSNRYNWLKLLTKILIITLPAEIVFLRNLHYIDPHYTPLHWIFHFFPALWLYTLAFVLIYKLNKKLKINFSFSKNKINLKKWTKRQGKTYLILLGIVMALNFGFGFYHIEKAALVDEPLWTFDRIPEFWKNVGERDWYGSRVSDKPGLTVAVISGFGLLKIDDPESYDKKDTEIEKMRELNFAFRFPILIFVVFSIPVIYSFLERLIDKKTAILSVIFVGLSPILVGVSRLINPDAILWIFTTLSLLSFLLFLEKKKDSGVIWAGIFLGFALLTKYVSNFLFIFFLGLIFLKHILSKKAQGNTEKFFKKNLFSYVVLIFVSLLTFFLAYPGTWIKPYRVILGTAYSEAFEPIFPIFMIILLASLVDTFLLKNFFLKNILGFVSKYRKLLIWFVSGFFLSAIVATFYNSYTGNSLFDFTSILSSPKSSFRDTTPLRFMLTNFYPLIFGISPVALLLIICSVIKSFIKTEEEKLRFRIYFYIIIFIILYYLGSLFSHVSSIVRYQIMLYPLALILSGISLSHLLSRFKNKKYYIETASIALIVFLGYVLLSIKPFYISYTSGLLPQKYHIDYKDMGVGSYEAADYLNSLSNAKEMSIWADKGGVCEFFVGKCNSRYDDIFEEGNFDYYVLSAGRETLATRKSNYIISHRDENAPNLKELYFDEDAEKVINLANRPSNFIKIFKSDALER